MYKRSIYKYHNNHNHNNHHNHHHNHHNHHCGYENGAYDIYKYMNYGLNPYGYGLNSYNIYGLNSYGYGYDMNPYRSSLYDLNRMFYYSRY